MEREGALLLFSERDQQVAGMPERAIIADAPMLIGRVLNKSEELDEALQVARTVDLRSETGRSLSLMFRLNHLNTLFSELVVLLPREHAE